MSFDWDDAKAASNETKHGVTFAEAASIFEDPLSLTIRDMQHSEDEERWIILGQSSRGRLLVVVHTERGDTLRIISARLATRQEIRNYERQHNGFS